MVTTVAAFSGVTGVGREVSVRRDVRAVISWDCLAENLNALIDLYRAFGLVISAGAFLIDEGEQLVACFAFLEDLVRELVVSSITND